MVKSTKATVLPFSISVKQSHAELVRQIANDHKLPWTEESYTDVQPCVRFRFGSTSDRRAIAFLSSVPNDAHSLHAVFSTDPPNAG
jgi:hypothetical protein